MKVVESDVKAKLEEFEEYSQLGESEKLSTICIAQHLAVLSEEEVGEKIVHLAVKNRQLADRYTPGSAKLIQRCKDLLDQKDEENSANSSEVEETNSLIKFSEEEKKSYNSEEAAGEDIQQTSSTLIEITEEVNNITAVLQQTKISMGKNTSYWNNLPIFDCDQATSFEYWLDDFMGCLKLDRTDEADYHILLKMKLSHEVREELRSYDAEEIDTFAKLSSVLKNKYDGKAQRDDARKESRNFEIDFRPDHTLESLKKLCQLLKRGYHDLSKKELLAQTIDTMMIRLEKKFRSLAERLREQKRDFENTSDLIHTVHGWLKDKTKYGYQRDVKDRNDVDVTCFNCKKKGHKKNQCKLLRKKPSFGDKSDDKPIVRRIDACTGKGIIVPVSINQVNDLSAFVDPGSDVCLMAIDNVTKFGVKNIMLCKEQLKVGDDQDWNVIGTGKITLTLGKKVYTVKCRLMNNMNIIHPADILLGDDFLKKTKGYEVDYEKGTFKTIRGECVQLIRTQLGEEKELKNAIRRIAIVDEESAHLEAEFKDDHDYVFSKNEWDIGKCTVKAKEMCLVENKSFPKVVRYVNNPQKQSIINEFEKRLIRDEIIVMDSEVSFISNHVLAKKGVDKWRCCVDTRALNKLLISQQVALPTFNEIYFKVGKAQYYFTLDCTQGFLQIELPLQTSKLFGVFTHLGVGRYTRLIYGSKNSTSAFVNVMQEVLSEFLFSEDKDSGVILYVDDIFGYACSIKDLGELAIKVVKKLHACGLKLNKEKSRLFATNIDFLSFEFGQREIRPSSDYIKKIMNYKVPTNTTQVRRYLGMVQYFKNHIENASITLIPLYDLLKNENNKVFNFSEKCVQAFNKVNEQLSSRPVIAPPIFGLPFELMVDSCKDAVGAILFQMQEGEKKVIGYFSKRFKEWKKKSSALEIELRGIIMALNHYMDLLTGSRLTILCDHKPMSSFVKNSKCARVMDMLETINSFDIDIKYKNAASIKPADALSRQYVRRIVLTGNDEILTSRPDNDTLLKIFQSFHDNVGHLGYNRTINLLKLRICYDGIAADFMNYLKSCEKCMAVNEKLYKNKVDMKIVTSKFPLEIVCSDVLGPLNVTINGHKYLLSLTDTMSRFTCLIPLRTITGEEIWNKMLDNFIYVHGIPYTLLTDGATYYTSQYFTEAATNLGITLKVGNPYYHLDNCIAERQFRSINGILRKEMALLTCQNTWDDFVPAIQFALNNTIHKSIKATPHQVFYGWKSLMPGENLSSKSAEYMVDYIKDPIIRKRAFELVAEITKQQQGEEPSHGGEKAEADLVENLPELKVGADVWIKLPSKNKLDTKWTGGYKIIKRLGNTCWVNTKSKGRPRRLHITHLKLDNKRKIQ